MWIFATEAIPAELLEAARIDGAGELRTFFQVALPLLAPGIVTVLLFTMVATWNNYFLPLIMLKDPDWYPLTLGLNAWNAQAATAGGEADLQPRHHRLAAHDRAADRRVPAAAALLAVRPRRRKRQGVTRPQGPTAPTQLQPSPCPTHEEVEAPPCAEPHAACCAASPSLSALALGATACGGSDDDSADSSRSPPTTSRPPSRRAARSRSGPGSPR